MLESVWSPLSYRGIGRRKHLTEIRLEGIHLDLSLGLGFIQKVARGLYVDPYAAKRIKGPEPYLWVRLPRAVLCLESALYVHQLLERRPVPVWVAIGRNARRPKVPELPLRFVRFTQPMLEEGVVTAQIDGFPVNVTCPSKTICDCLRYRAKIARGVAEAALTQLLRQGGSLSELQRFAKICDVERPLESILALTSPAGSARGSP